MALKSNKEFVSRVIGGLRALSKDGRISRRLVLSTGRDKADYLMSQKFVELSLFKEDTIISYLNCFPMCEIETKSCDIFEFKLCESIMKSKFRLPRAITGKNGPAIISVSNVDGSIKYNYISEKRYSEQKERRGFDKSDAYFTIKDGYIYLPNSTNELIDISLIATDKWEIDQIPTCGSSVKNCKSKWDYDFVCIDRLYESVVTGTVQELASIWARIVPDSNPNLDPNQKTKTVK